MKNNNLSKNLDNIKKDIIISKAINNSIKKHNYNIKNGDEKCFILKLNKKNNPNTIDNCFIEEEISLKSIRDYNNAIVHFIDDINKRFYNEINNDKNKILKEDIEKIETKIKEFECNNVFNKIKTLTSPNKDIETCLIKCSIRDNRCVKILDRLKTDKQEIWSLEKAEEFIKSNIEYTKKIFTEIKEKFRKQEENIKIEKVTSELINDACKKYMQEQNIKIEKDIEKTFIAQFDKSKNYECCKVCEVQSPTIAGLLDYTKKLNNYGYNINSQYQDIINNKKEVSNEDIDNMERELEDFKNDKCFINLKNNLPENDNIETYIQKHTVDNKYNYIYESSKELIELQEDKIQYEQVHSHIQDIIDKIKQINQKKEQDEEKKRKIEEGLKLKEQQKNEIKQQKKRNIKKVKKAKSHKQYRCRRRLQELCEMGTKQNLLKNLSAGISSKETKLIGKLKELSEKGIIKLNLLKNLSAGIQSLKDVDKAKNNNKSKTF